MWIHNWAWQKPTITTDENMDIWYTFWDSETMWEISKKLRENLIWIQRWDIEDTHGWVTIL